MTKILILGGSQAQVPLLKSAKEEGYKTILCDSRKSGIPGAEFCDKQYFVNTNDKIEILNVAKKEKIDGIISNSEFAMITVAYVSEKLGLPGNPLSAIEILSSKDKFRTLQEKIGIFAPKHQVVDNYDSFLSAINKFKVPFIVKPVESSGSRGTIKIESLKSTLLKKAFEENIAFSRNGKCSIEEFVEMPTLEVIDGDIFVMKDEIIWEGLFMSLRSPKAPMVPKVQLYPLNMPKYKIDEVKEVLTRIIREVGITHGVYNVEMYYTKDNQPFVIEINVRQGGNDIPDTIYKHCGINMYKLLVTTCVGDNKYYNYVKNSLREYKYLTRLPIFSYKSGIYKGLHIDKNIKNKIKDITELVEVGDKVEKCKNAESVIGFVNIFFENSEEQEQFSYNIDKYICAIIKG